MMNSDQLHALADALEPMAKAPRFEDFDVPAFCAWVRACADAEPVGYVTANGLRSLRQDDATVLLYAHDYLIRPDHVALYTRPAPAAPQAEPCIGNDSACPCQDGDACHYKDAADGTKAWPVPQAEPEREPTDWLSTDDAETQLAMALQTVGIHGDDKRLLDALNCRGIWLARMPSGGSDAE